MNPPRPARAAPRHLFHQTLKRFARRSPVNATMLHLKEVEGSAYRRAEACEAYAEVGSADQPHKPVVRLAINPASDPVVAAAFVTLSLGYDAPLTDVKSAYRTLAARWHPDVGGNARAMRRLNRAYDVLCRHFGSA